MQWSVRPFVRIVLFYIPGILLGNKLDDYDIGLYPILIFSILLIGGFAIARWYSSYRKGWWAGLFARRTVDRCER